MPESIVAFLRDFAHHIRFVDVLDIAFISFFLYVIINWLRQSVSWKAMLSVFILVAVYFLARFFDMYLTEMLIEGLFFVILIGIVVVFQSDIRRFMDRLGTWRFLSGRPSLPSSSLTIDTLTEAASKMAAAKTGALIIIHGSESWDRHVHGGIPLNGEITIPLLLSIFNTKSPGHDGAVLIEGDKIVKFGTHLPLSTKLYKIGSGGTRHAAALGISELCDAFVIVVSEERGVISVASEGDLNVLSSPGELKNHLEAFWLKHYSDEGKNHLVWWKKRSLRTAIFSIALAVTFWFAFAYQTGNLYRTFEVPIEFKNLKSSKVAFTDSVPVNARVTLSGSQQAFRLFDSSQLVISFDLSKVDPNSKDLIINRDNMNLPADLHVYETLPQTITIHKKKFLSRLLPVKVDTTGSLQKGLILEGISINPSKIHIEISDADDKGIKSISTAEVDLSDISQTTKITRQLQLPGDVQLSQKESSRVAVTIKVKHK
ncbi:MAG TPA: diadenylate cyclase [Balneolales bacterium]|nr:diadenylate cyclase [Balneolales bacterium]